MEPNAQTNTVLKMDPSPAAPPTPPPTGVLLVEDNPGFEDDVCLAGVDFAPKSGVPAGGRAG